MSDTSKTVFITGAGKRLGRHFALGFAQQGWDVAVHYHSSEDGAQRTVEEIRTLGQKAIAVQADVRSSVEVRRAVDEAAAALGTPRVLVANSGIFPAPAALSQIDDAMWGEALSINLLGGFHAAQAFAALTPQDGRIIIIGSLGGLQIWRQRIPYNVSKTAAIQLTKALARELAPEISVNCVCPGAVSVASEPSEADNSLLPPARIPMKRHATPEDVFDPVYFFATASRYITGQILAVDGGILLTGG